VRSSDVPFEYREHTGEAWLVATGTTLEEAFAEGARALFHLMVNLTDIEVRQEREISCQAEDIERLFVEWLNALIVEKDAQGLIFSRFEVLPLRKTRGSYELVARAWGEPFDAQKHESRVDVKAATYAGLQCEKTKAGYRVECVVDI
jgi:SHS2 domain-containing protein